ncbi:MAG: hypothetical protein HQL46_01530 [Gammaproteobacteria bacterium]|nr:hypothetical protein [Gammaproteobacteria bacterium]
MRNLFILVFLINVYANAFAISSQNGTFNLSGYGTLAYTSDNVDDLAFIRELTQPPITGVANNPSIKTDPWLTDSRIGVQGLFQYGNTLEVMGLLNIRRQEETNLNNSLDWLYLGYHPNENLNLRFGRVGYDAFLMSDHRHLGYAYPWVRPSTEFYAAIPVYAIDGLDISYNISGQQDIQWKVKAQWGTSKETFPFGIDNSYEMESTSWTIGLTRETSYLRIRTRYSEMDIETNPKALESLYAGLTQIASAGIVEASDLLQELSFKDTKVKYTTLGFSYDNNAWLSQGELGYLKTSSSIVTNGTTLTGYINFGKRIGNWTPYVAYSSINPLESRKQAKTDWNALTGNQAGDLNSVRDQTLGILTSTRLDQRTLSLGVRWDIHSQVATKFQWDHTKIRSDGYGLWWGTTDESKATSVDVLTLTMEFIF